MAAILAIDSSTDACSCALSIDDTVTEAFEHAPRAHAQRLLPMISQLMDSKGLTYRDLDALAFACGPGSFTGLRICAGIAQGIAFGANLPVIPVSTLAAMAMEAWLETGHELIFSCLDARIGEVYWGVYRIENGIAVLEGREAVDKPGSVNLPPAPVSLYGAGSGMSFLREMRGDVQVRIEAYAPDIVPRSGRIAVLGAHYLAAGKTIRPEEISPTYLRNKVTHG